MPLAPFPDPHGQSLHNFGYCFVQMFPMGQAVLQAITPSIHHDWPVEMFTNKAATPHSKRTAKQPQLQTFIIPQ